MDQQLERMNREMYKQFSRKTSPNVQANFVNDRSNVVGRNRPYTPSPSPPAINNIQRPQQNTKPYQGRQPYQPNQYGGDNQQHQGYQQAGRQQYQKPQQFDNSAQDFPQQRQPYQRGGHRQPYRQSQKTPQQSNNYQGNQYQRRQSPSNIRQQGQFSNRPNQQYNQRNDSRSGSNDKQVQQQRSNQAYQDRISKPSQQSPFPKPGQQGQFNKPGQQSQFPKPGQQSQFTNSNQQANKPYQQRQLDRPFRGDRGRGQRGLRGQRARGRGGHIEPPRPRYVEKAQPSNQKQDSFIKDDKQSLSQQMQEQSQNVYSRQSQSNLDQQGQSRSGEQQYESGSQKPSQQGSNNQQQQGQSQQGSQVQEQQLQESQQQQSYSQSIGESQSQAVPQPSNNNAILPALQTDISTAVIDLMCPKQQFKQRLQTFQYNNNKTQILKLDTSRSFSVFQINKLTMVPDFNLALKRFKRSADRAEDDKEEDDTKDCRRSVKALIKVIHHINKQIIDADKQKLDYLAFPKPPGERAFEFIHIYDFLWDRMRQMIKDITRLSPKEKVTKEIITISQQIARFFILSINEGRKKYKSKLKFDERMNIQSIIKVISNLMEFYRESRMNLKKLIQDLSEQERRIISVQKIQKLMQKHGVYISPHEPQLSAYSFLFSDNRKKEFYQILTIGFQDPISQSQNPLITSQQMIRALISHRILCSHNIEQYFHQIQNPQNDYLFCCMLLKHLNSIRKETTKMLFKTNVYYKGDSFLKNTILKETLRKILRFTDNQEQQFNQFIHMFGIQINGNLLNYKDAILNQDLYHIPEYIFQRNKLERKDWTDQKSTKHLLKSSQLSRQELIRSSWKQSNYDKNVIAFYLGAQMNNKTVQKIKKAPVSRIAKPIQQAKQSLQIRQSPSVSVQKPEGSKQSLSKLTQMRKNIQTKKKRTIFLQKFECEVKQLYKHTDQLKFMNRKQSLSILDEWMMYYQDKMLKLSLDLIQKQANKKQAIISMLRQIKIRAQEKQKFNQMFNKTDYQFICRNQENIRNHPENKQKGKMSYLLGKAHQKGAQKGTDNLEEYLQSHHNIVKAKKLSLLILNTCSNTSQYDSILLNLIIYFARSKKCQLSSTIRQIKQVLKTLQHKQKLSLPIQLSFTCPQVHLTLRIFNILPLKTSSNRHILPFIFGCDGLFILRQSNNINTSQVILQNLEEFVNNKSRIFQQVDQQHQFNIEMIKHVQMPVLIINCVRNNQKDSPRIPTNTQNNKTKFNFLKNLKELTVLESMANGIKLPFIMRLKLQEQMGLILNQSASSVQINIKQGYCIKSLSQLLIQIRKNASYIQQTVEQRYESQNIQQKKQFMFAFYQQYFNLCIAQISKSVKQTYKRSIQNKSWIKCLLLSQNLISTQQFVSSSTHQQQKIISSCLEHQQNFNVIYQTLKQYQFLERFLYDIKMNIVGEYIQPIQTKYLVFYQDSSENVFNQLKKGFQTRNNVKTSKDLQKQFQFTHFINNIAKYLNLFDQNQLFNNDKFQSLITVFQQHGLEFNMYSFKDYKQKRSYLINEQSKTHQNIINNFQIQGDSLQFFSYMMEYLIQSCNKVKIILPLNFLFQIQTQKFFRQSSDIIYNPIRVLCNLIPHPPIQTFTPSPSLSTQYNQVLLRYNTLQQQKKSSNQPIHQINKFSVGEQVPFDQFINVDQISQISRKDDEQSREFQRQRNNNYEENSRKRDLDYHHSSTFKQIIKGFVYQRANLIQNLRKKVKAV